MKTFSLRVFFFLLIVLSHWITPVVAQGIPPNKNLVDQEVIAEIRKLVDIDIVQASIEDQNVKYGNISESKIIALDKKWHMEMKSNDQPLMVATLSNPLSAYLTRVQAHSNGIYIGMLAMDRNGLNVGQSNISSDYWQGDKAKFQKTFLMGGTAVFVGTPEYDKVLGIWRIPVNLSISDASGQNAIGAIAVELNLSELARRKYLAAM